MKFRRIKVGRKEIPDKLTDHQLKVLKKWAKYWETSILLRNGIRVDKDGTVTNLKTTSSQANISDEGA